MSRISAIVVPLNIVFVSCLSSVYSVSISHEIESLVLPCAFYFASFYRTNKKELQRPDVEK